MKIEYLPSYSLKLHASRCGIEKHQVALQETGAQFSSTWQIYGVHLCLVILWTTQSYSVYVCGGVYKPKGTIRPTLVVLYRTRKLTMGKRSLDLMGRVSICSIRRRSISGIYLTAL